MFTYTAFTADIVEAGPAGRERGRYAEMAFCSEPAWRLLEGRHEARLPGRGFLDAAEVHAGRSRQGRLALCAVRHLEDRRRQEEPCRPDASSAESTLDHKSFTDRAPKLGGLIEFYRSPARVQWSPTGTNIPDYPKLAQLWWQAIGDASSGAKTAQEAMDSLCAEQEKRARAPGALPASMGDIGPKLAEEHDLAYWNKDAVSKAATSRRSSRSRTRRKSRSPSTTTSW